MLGMSWAEIFVVLIVLMLVVPAHDLPRILRFLGKGIIRIRHIVYHFQDNMNKILEDSDLYPDPETLIKKNIEHSFDEDPIHYKKPDFPIENSSPLVVPQKSSTKRITKKTVFLQKVEKKNQRKTEIKTKESVDGNKEK